MNWDLYKNLPIPVCVYRVSSADVLLEYENTEFAALNLSADFLGLRSWIVDSATLDSQARPLRTGQVVFFSKRKIENAPGYWTLTAKVSVVVQPTYAAPSVVSRPDVPYLDENHSLDSKRKSLYTSIATVNDKIDALLRKAAARSEEDVWHVVMVLELLSLPDRIGSMEQWPSNLWENLVIMFDCPFVCAIYWGAEYKLIYNYAFRPITGIKHPHCIGLPAAHAACWGDIWDEIGEPFQHTGTTGLATYKSRDLLVLNTHGYPEEFYYDWSVISIGGPNEIYGLFNFVIECTDEILNDRRLNVLYELNVLTSRASKLQDYYDGLSMAVSTLPQDLPTMLIYACQDDGIARLAGSVAYPARPNSQIPQVHEFGAKHSSTMGKLLNVVFESQQSVVCIDREVLSEFEYVRGWAEPCVCAVVAPIFTENRQLLAIMVVGINPRKKLDNQYRRYLDILFNQISIGLSNLHHLVTQIASMQMIANMEASRGRDLELMLRQKSEELIISQQHYVRMAEEVPAGMYTLDTHGRITYINKKGVELIGGPEMYNNPDEPFLAVHPDWQEELHAKWKEMVEEKKDMSYEVRCSVDREDGSERWVAGSINVDTDPKTGLTSLTGFLVDTSEQRRAEYLINKRADDAQESKRQQEAFIDMTSHELRNPLSAIVQSVDLVQTGLERMKLATSPQEMFSIVDDEQSNLSNIDLCAQHMKRIIDDTINISKIESNLLVITPDPVDVFEFVNRTLTMFKGEMTMQHINVNTEFGKGLEKGAKFMLDPARTSQILINLITNSIKFLAGVERERKITVRVNTAKVPPFGNPPRMNRRRQSESHPTFDRSSPASSDGAVRLRKSSTPDSIPTMIRGPTHSHDSVFLVFTVCDTGPGMSTAESASLFQRFSQCTPKTHVKYGGSGLGLHICRKLVELQGGEIKCDSATNKGATFTFYIMSEPASDKNNDLPMPDTITSHPQQAIPKHRENLSLQHHSIQSDHHNKNGSFWDNQAEASDGPNPLSTTKGIKALVVEDNLLNQRILQKQLLKAGYDVSVANHGLECLAAVREDDFDVILLDREMPVCDGLECLLQLRQMENREGTPATSDSASPYTDPFDDCTKSPSKAQVSSHTTSPTTLPLEYTHLTTPSSLKRKRRHHRTYVIAISANARTEQVDEMMVAGADDYLTKPFRFPDLDMKIRDLLANR